MKAWLPALLVSIAFGLVFADLTISGWIHGWEGRVALLLLAVIAGGAAFRSTDHPVRLGFVVAFLAGLVAIELQALYLPLYFENNPDYALIEMPFGLAPRLVTAVGAPISATFAGVITAGMVWVLVKFRKAPRFSRS